MYVENAAMIGEVTQSVPWTTLTHIIKIIPPKRGDSAATRIVIVAISFIGTYKGPFISNITPETYNRCSEKST